MWPILAAAGSFLTKTALPWLAKNVLPAVMSGLGGGGGQQGAGQAQQQQPMNQFMPGGMMASRQMPSYGQMIQQMLSQQRGQ
jgi:hypothetical protein